ncbi:uncharacterized protein LOC123538847 isoform X2 [Mercenaria mercenaria]|uniref:uncharacterized protein LOC123538847 isoform X2 n=1 Tax=Mercenaria mercenaria TaxID=6596 RepID=UPI00234E6020|nr:uncharacterized protein LOC123538847 isoform X2 [Mercenaria mercenaria]
MAYIILSVFCGVLLHFAYSYPHFGTKIPNGEKVPSPCNPNYVWQGVGHEAKGGGGSRNPFGKDFAAQGFTWTKALCRADSDEDGKTNGEELGDPNCTWEVGSTPQRSFGLSHPGFCDPYNSTKCMTMNKFLNCSATEFKCSAVDEDPDIKPVDVRLDTSPVPSEETTYMCQVIDLPTDRDYHLVANKPYIDNINVMHHAVVYGCTDSAKIEPKHLSPTTCFMNRLEGCQDVIALWTVGSSGLCYHENAGFRVGKTGYKKALIELHWNNPMHVGTYTDGSGITIYLTPNLRAHDAGMFYIGQSRLEIPPGKERYTANSTCTSKCIQRKMVGNIKIVGALNHMHYLGYSATSQMVTNEGKVYHISHEESYSYDTPKFVIFDEPLVVEPEYSLQLTCNYRSTSRSEITYFGEGTSDEMCFTFLVYYPKNKWTGDECTSFGNYDSCGFDPNLQDGGCDFRELANYSHPITAARNARLYGNCEPGFCKVGCLEVVRDIFKEPCFQEENLKLMKESLRTAEGTAKLTIMDYFYRIDSCNTELAREQCKWKPDPDVNGATNGNMASFSFILSVAVFVVYL